MNHGRGFLEYKHRIVYSLFRAAARVGIRLNMPIDQMESLFQMAYFREAREERHLELQEIADLFGKSLRTVSSLHRRYRGDFFAPEDEVQLRRQVASALAQRPATLAEIVERLDLAEAERVRTAVDDLVREGRILEVNGQLQRNPEAHNFFDPGDIVGRVDGLNRQMDILAQTVWERLIETENGTRAAARSYVFSATDAEFDAILEDMIALVRDRAVAADGHAQAKGLYNRRAITLAATSLEDE